MRTFRLFRSVVILLAAIAFTVLSIQRACRLRQAAVDRQQFKAWLESKQDQEGRVRTSGYSSGARPARQP